MNTLRTVTEYLLIGILTDIVFNLLKVFIQSKLILILATFILLIPIVFVTIYLIEKVWKVE